MGRKTFDMIASNTLEVIESPLTILPNMQPTFTLNIAGNETIDTPTMKLYKGSKDVSSTCLTGTMSVSGRTITCKTIFNLTPGDWVFYVYFNDGGVPTERFCRFTVPREGA